MLEGLTYDTAPQLQPAAWAALQSAGRSSRIPGGGESLEDMEERVVGTLEHIAAKHPGKSIVLGSERPLHCPLGRAAPKHYSNQVFKCVVLSKSE